MNRIARTLTVGLLALAPMSIAAAPAHASSWKPTMVPLSATDARHAAGAYAGLCAHTSLASSRSEAGRWTLALCSPAKASLNPAAARVGWCLRWGAQHPDKISDSCRTDIRYAYLAGF